MSLRTIAAQFTHRAPKLTDSRNPQALTTLKMIYEGGSIDGKTASFPTRDISSVVVGLHRRNWHFFETYERTIWVNVHDGRTIFRCAGVTVKSNDSSWWKRLLSVLRVRKTKAIVI